MAEIDFATAKLIPGPVEADGTLRAIVDVQLADGFKTYWFMPGDGGLPPSFTAGNSKVRIHLPAPKRIQDEYGTAVGYSNQVEIPLTLSGEIPEAGETLSVDMMIGVCADICIPFIATMEAPIPDEAMPRTTFAFNDAFGNLPGAFSENFQATDINLVDTAPEKGELALTAKVTIPADTPADEIDIFAAIKGNGNFYSSAPELEAVSSSKPGSRQYRVTIPVSSALKAEQFSGSRVTLTLVAKDMSVEGELKLP